MKHEHEPNVPDGTGAAIPLKIPNGILRVAMIFAASLFFASHLTWPLVPVVLGQFLLVAAVVSTAIAIFNGERPFSAILTRWDEAAILAGLALLTGVFVDPEAVQTALRELSPQVPEGTS